MGIDHLRELSVLLTTDCNLRCVYCYQDAKRPGAIGWPPLRAALDRLLDSPAEKPAVSFAGGEPGLAWGLIRRAVAYATGRTRDSRPVSFHLITNGLLIGASALRFLSSHDVKLELSFDGVPAAQDLRGPASFGRLDGLLDLLHSRHPDYLGRQVSVTSTIARGTIPHLAASFAYFVRKGVPSVSFHAAMGQEEWSLADLESLDAQLSEIVALSIEHHAATGRIPLTLFRSQHSRGGRRMAWGCSAPLGRALAVDVDGQVYPCAVLARSYQTFAPAVDGRMRRLALGDVRHPAFPERLARLADTCRSSGLFEPKRVQHSGERRCARCREQAACVICPIARAKRPDVAANDLNDIPRYLCAYERILGKHRRRFFAQVPASSGEQLLFQLLGERREARQPAPSTSTLSRSRLRQAAP